MIELACFPTQIQTIAIIGFSFSCTLLGIIITIAIKDGIK